MPELSSTALGMKLITTLWSTRRATSAVAAIAFAILCASLFFLNMVTLSTYSIPLSKSSQAGQSSSKPPWLIAIVSTGHHLQRRQLIRSTWQSLYKNDTIFNTRFVLGKPDPVWEAIIRKENETYGDIITLNHAHEDHFWANRAKTMELFKHIIHNYSHTEWKFISKADEDTFIDAKNFWRLWLRPRIERDKVNGTYIGRPVTGQAQFTYGQGGFYTLSKDMIELLANLHDQNHIDNEHEDLLVGRLMEESGTPFNLTQLSFRAAFDFEDNKARGDGSAWAPRDQNLDEVNHGVAPGALAPHNLKEDDRYLRVAACYDAEGLKENDYWASG